MPADQQRPDDRQNILARPSGGAPDSPTADSVSVTSPAQPGISPHLLSGTWGSLEILEQVGRGGFGCVYRARDPALDREVALKIIDVPSRAPARVAEVLREGRLLARVRHPNVVTVYGAHESGGVVGIWMELVHGRSLAEVVRREGSMGPEEASVVGVGVCRALAAVHGAGLIHRDVKAQNVMREAGGRIVLMDFGAGWELTDATRHGAVLPTGTPLYMAPELFTGAAPSAASDIYSLGVLLFFLVTGTHPVEGRTISDVGLAHDLGRRRLLGDTRPDLPNAFLRVVERALATSPDRRYQTAGALMRDLVEAIPQNTSPRQDAGPDTLAANAAPEKSVPRTSALATPSVGATPEPVRRAYEWTSPLAWTIGAAAVSGSIGMLGLLTSLAFDLTLGRVEGFSHESVLAWWIWGVRSLVQPVFEIVFALGGMWVAAQVLRPLTSLRPVRTVIERVSGLVRSAAAKARVENPVTAGKLIVVLQIVALASFSWRFGDLISAFMSYISTDDASKLAELAPGNRAAHDSFRSVLPLVILGMAVAWTRVWKWQRRIGVQADRAAVATGVALIVIAMILLTLPYRILRHNEFQRVQFEHERCYVIGDHGQELLLYCPDAQVPRNKVVSANDARVVRMTLVESIFSTH